MGGLARWVLLGMWGQVPAGSSMPYANPEKSGTEQF